MALLNSKAELDGQEIIADKSHQQDKIINDGLDTLTLSLRETFAELFGEILPQNIYKNVLELRCSWIARTRGRGLG